MCGIVGIFEFGSSKTPQAGPALAMAASLRHRGPDDEGYVLFDTEAKALSAWGPDTPDAVRAILPEGACDIRECAVKSRALLAHRRLSILDVSSAGHQPMAAPGGRYWICFNGEIYNYVELRAELEALGETFVTAGDTEVALRAYLVWGNQCCEKFNGDWAMIIYDRAEHRLFVSRDRFGIKPLYFYQDDTRIVFASEIKAFLAHPKLSVSADHEIIRTYMKNGSNEWSDETPFKGVHRFPFAHFADISLKRAFDWAPRQYYSLAVNRSRESFDPHRAREYADQYFALLKNAVQIRMRSDVPLGCALSGGLDSSSVVYLADQILREQGYDKKLQTFSLVHTDPADKALDESGFIDILAHQVEFESFRRCPNVEDAQTIIHDVIRHWETPPDGFGLAGFVTVGIANDLGLVVTLDGQGADEVQAGYHHTLISYLGGLSFREFFREAAALERNLAATPKYIAQLIALGFLLNRTGPRTFNFVSRLFGRNFQIQSRTLGDELKRSVGEGLVNLLHYADARSMYYSIESRMPFMDHRLIDFSLSIPDCYKVHDGYTKYFARLAFDGKLPDEITWRKDKMGWPVPAGRWINDSLSKWSEDQIVKSGFVQSLGLGDRVLSPKLKPRALNVAVWHDIFFGKRT